MILNCNKLQALKIRIFNIMKIKERYIIKVFTQLKINKVLLKQKIKDKMMYYLNLYINKF